MNHDLRGKTVAILATDGFEQSELEKPRDALQDAGAETEIVSLKKGKIKGWDTDDFGDSRHISGRSACSQCGRLGGWRYRVDLPAPVSRPVGVLVARCGRGWRSSSMRWDFMTAVVNR